MINKNTAFLYSIQWNDKPEFKIFSAQENILILAYFIFTKEIKSRKEAENLAVQNPEISSEQFAEEVKSHGFLVSESKETVIINDTLIINKVDEKSLVVPLYVVDPIIFTLFSRHETNNDKKIDLSLTVRVQQDENKVSYFVSGETFSTGYIHKEFDDYLTALRIYNYRNLEFDNDTKEQSSE